MAAKTTEWRPGPTVCRCCLSEGCYKDISTEYFWMGKREVYADMLSETFDLSIAYSQSGGPNSHSRLICEPCISRLRDAADFKRQVQECERTFTTYLDPGNSVADMEVSVEVDRTDSGIKVECVKEEKGESDDDDFDDRPDFGDDDDYDDLDDQPLTKLASKIPKKESVEILELLTNDKVTEKRKSSTKTKSSSAKKVKTKKEIATSSKEKPEPRKKKGPRPTSIWQMTIPERKNAAIFLLYTTVRPFLFMGSSFKCFFCLQYYSEIPQLLEHTSTHNMLDKDTILEKYIPKGKRTIQVDISRLKCRLCDQSFGNLDVIRNHLKAAHCKQFSPASNGMTEYKMEVVNGHFVCHICNEQFVSFAHLNSHINNHVGKVFCETCGAGFLTKYLLIRHKDTHVNKSIKCKFCDNIFFKKSQLKYHIAIVHQGKTRAPLKKCSLCDETFKEHYSKMVHLKIRHGVVKSFPCSICKANFETRRALTEHTTKKHTEKFKCEICSRCFSIESRLKVHVRTHTGEKGFICPICKNTYKHKVTLNKHMQYHNVPSSS